VRLDGLLESVWMEEAFQIYIQGQKQEQVAKRGNGGVRLPQQMTEPTVSLLWLQSALKQFEEFVTVELKNRPTKIKHPDRTCPRGESFMS